MVDGRLFSHSSSLVLICELPFCLLLSFSFFILILSFICKCCAKGYIHVSPLIHELRRGKLPRKSGPHSRAWAVDSGLFVGELVALKSIPFKLKAIQLESKSIAFEPNL